MPEKKYQQHGIICFLFIFFFFSNILFAGERKNILILNSDASVEKYKEVQDEFKKVISYPVSEIDLRDERKKIPELESLLNKKSPDLIYCIGSKAYLITRKYDNSDRDILFTSIINWHRLPITTKTYGVSTELHTGMQVMMFHLIFPNIQKIGVLYSKQYNREWFGNTMKETKDMGVRIIGKAVSDNNEVISVLKALLADSDAFWLIPDPVIMADKKMLFEVLKICDARKIPIFCYNDVFVKYGAILSVSADNSTIGRQAAGVAVELLEKGKINEKIQFPAGTHITLNMKKIKEYGLKYSEDALGTVNSIIE